MKPKLGFALCGSFCTHSKALAVMRELAADYELIPILSENAASTDTRFGTAVMLKETVSGISGRKPVMSITEAEKFAASPLDYLIICPCTGNTAAKMANGVTDTAVTMAAKAHLRTDRPLLLALASNDAMSANFCTIGTLLGRKQIYFVPMQQDDVVSKPHSLVADISRVPLALESMREGKQLRPLFL
ncbi:MAG: dipicolinate synthase subunit B [Clostridia bacterium]|nr:dipicolinate synthase subunit B [Clostridia bacterium]